LTPVTKVRKKKKKVREIILDEPTVDVAVDEMPDNATLSDNEVNRRKEERKSGKNVLSKGQVRGLEDIDFEEEERLEREAIETDRIARQNRSQQLRLDVAESVDEPLVVERVKKKKKKKNAVGDISTEKKKKAKATEP